MHSYCIEETVVNCLVNNVCNSAGGLMEDNEAILQADVSVLQHKDLTRLLWPLKVSIQQNEARVTDPHEMAEKKMVSQHTPG